MATVNRGGVDSAASHPVSPVSPTRSSVASTPPAVASGPPYLIGVRQLTVTEPTQQVKIAGQVTERVIPTVVRYPARTGVAGTDNPNALPAPGAFPLVVFAPGYLQCGSAYESLLRSWTAAGFVVAEVRFPLTNCHVADPNESDILNQPFDVSSVISQLLADSADPGSPLYGLIDPQRVAVAGHSDGGDTAAAVAFDTCCRDGQVSAAVILAGAELPSFGGSYFPKGSVPALFVQGTDDKVNVPADTQKLYNDDHTGAKALLWLDGAGHFPPYEGDDPTEQIVARVTTDFLRMTLLGSGQAGVSMVKDGNVSGQSTLTTAHMPSAG